MRACPHCGTTLTYLSKRRGVCQDCFAPLRKFDEPTFEAEPVFEDDDLYEPRRPSQPTRWRPEPNPWPRSDHVGSYWWMMKMKLYIAGGTLLLLFLMCGGFFLLMEFSPKYAMIDVDNATADPLTVYIDGEKVETIPARSSGRVRCKVGEHEIRVTRGGKTVFDETKTVEQKEYVLNPDKQHRYFVRTVKYGTGRPLDRERDDEQTFQESLDRFLSIVSPVEHSGSWFQYPQDWSYEDYGLDEEIPDVLRNGSSTSLTRRALLRMTREDYNLLIELRNLKGEPTKDQLQQWRRCMIRLRKIPYRKPKKRKSRR